MRQLHLQRKQIDLKQFVKRSALESDYKNLITDDVVVFVDGQPVIVYCKLPWDFSNFRAVCERIEYQQSERTGGLKTISRVFGFQPRVALRRDYCTATSLAYTDAEANAVVGDFGVRIQDLYRQWFPVTAKAHEDLARDKILPEWKIKGTAFTSGIINKNNPLKYHYDSGNFDNVCSCMLGLKKDIGGGYLAIPELDIALEISDGSLTVFDGQSLLHGVTPIRRASPRAYRYTTVYYTLKGMWNCEPLTLELARIRQKKTEREQKRAGLDVVIVDQHGEREET